MGWKVISPLFMGTIPAGIHVLKQSDGPPKVHVFKDWQGAVASAAAGEHVLQAFGSFAAFGTYFGGYMTFGRVFSSDEFLGVWGQRNASRFRRILRERLGELEIVHAQPPARLAGRELSHAGPTAEQRKALEAKFRPRP